MCTESRTHTDSRRNVLRAALELGEGIAAVRRRLDRARGIDPNSPNFNALEPEAPRQPDVDRGPTSPSS